MVGYLEAGRIVDVSACEAPDGTDCSAVGVTCGGFCVDSDCCNTACGSLCEACAESLSGGACRTWTFIAFRRRPGGRMQRESHVQRRRHVQLMC